MATPRLIRSHGMAASKGKRRGSFEPRLFKNVRLNRSYLLWQVKQISLFLEVTRRNWVE